MTPVEAVQTVQRVAAAIRDAIRCPAFAGETEEPCDGLYGCEMCLTLAAVAAMGAMRPRAPLTEKQRAVLTYIEDSIFQRGVAPTYDEIAERFTLASLASVAEYLEALQSKGYIHRSAFKPRGITLVES